MRVTRILEGRSSGWVQTGLTVNQGTTVRVQAGELIRFASKVPGNGYPRDPDGRDEHGAQEFPAGNHGDGHPAPLAIKDSLVLRIGSFIVQAGSDMSFQSPASGPIEMTCNDNVTWDNDGAWNIVFDGVDEPSPPHPPVPSGVQFLDTDCMINGFVHGPASGGWYTVNLTLFRDHATGLDYHCPNPTSRITTPENTVWAVLEANQPGRFSPGSSLRFGPGSQDTAGNVKFRADDPNRTVEFYLHFEIQTPGAQELVKYYFSSSNRRRNEGRLIADSL